MADELGSQASCSLVLHHLPLLGVWFVLRRLRPSPRLPSHLAPLLFCLLVPPLAQEEAASRAVIPLAVRLISLEQSIPDAATASGATRADWDKWE